MIDFHFYDYLILTLYHCLMHFIDLPLSNISSVNVDSEAEIKGCKISRYKIYCFSKCRGHKPERFSSFPLFMAIHNIFSSVADYSDTNSVLHGCHSGMFQWPHGKFKNHVGTSF